MASADLIRSVRPVMDSARTFVVVVSIMAFHAAWRCTDQLPQDHSIGDESSRPSGRATRQARTPPVVNAAVRSVAV